MKIKHDQTFDKFLATDSRAQEITFQQQHGWKHKFEDWNKSLHLIFLILAYCAENGVKISYAALGRLAGVPKQYTRGQSIGVIIGAMLEIVGRYCQTLPGGPKLTSLCVSFISGFPGAGYFLAFDSENVDKSLESQKDVLLNTYKSLKKYDWPKAIKISGIDENLDGLPLKEETFPQENFYIPKSSHAIVESESVTDVLAETTDGIEYLLSNIKGSDKEKIAKSLRVSGRCFSVGVIFITLVIMFYNFYTGKGNFQLLYILSMPIAFCLWNIYKIVQLSMHVADLFCVGKFAGNTKQTQRDK